MKVGEVLKLSAGLRRKNCDAAAAELCERLQLDREKKVEDLSFGGPGLLEIQQERHSLISFY